MGDAMSLGGLAKALPTLHVDLEVSDFAGMCVTPWFSFTTVLPVRPLPGYLERPQIETERLCIRPITMDDLDAFWELRQIAETQVPSKERGRPDASKDDTRRQIESLVEFEQDQWYYGAFLRSTGEMIGEGGLYTVNRTSLSGWPEVEFLIKPQYWRQGYGTEMFNAIVDSWWDLPREWRRLQIIPALTPGFDPGCEVPESLVFQWEEPNEAARLFFAKVLANRPAAAEGGASTYDTRPGREGNIVRWSGTAAVNPREPPPRPVVDDDE